MFGCICSMWKFQGQGSNQSHCRDNVCNYAVGRRGSPSFSLFQSMYLSSRWDTMGLAVSWEPRDAYWSPAWHCSWGIQHCCSCGLGCSCGLVCNCDSDPIQRIPYATGWPKKKKEKKKTKKQKQQQKKEVGGRGRRRRRKGNKVSTNRLLSTEQTFLPSRTYAQPMNDQALPSGSNWSSANLPKYLWQRIF